jgi:23S rRNA maturation mini-RNase III
MLVVGRHNSAKSQGRAMKDLREVLRRKEEEILRVREEVEALRIAAGLLGEEEKSSTSDRKNEYRQPLPMP